VYVGRENDLYSSTAVCHDINFQGMTPGNYKNIKCLVKTRYAAPPVPACLSVDGDTAVIAFDSPAKAVTPGQSAVVYDGERILLGGVIESGM